MAQLDKEAFARLIEPHFDRLFRLAYRLCGTRSDAEDLVQDVLIRLFERRDELSSIRDLKPWLGRVLYNRFVDGTRSYGRQPLQLVADDLMDASADNDPAVAASDSQRIGELSAALDRLSEDHRTVILMHDAEGYTLPEIETLTGIPIGTLKSRLNRARSRLRDLLGSSMHAGGALPTAGALPAAGALPTGRPATGVDSATDRHPATGVAKKMEPFPDPERVGE